MSADPFILVVLLVGLALYAVLGGADFGGGIYELIRGDRAADKVTHALSPVWEVNHVWLILVVVVVFNVFPALYAFWSVELHVPIMLALLGIVVRGTAFTFRHYDPVTSPLSRFYTLTFRASSALTPMMLGVVVAALMQGHLAPPDATFAARFIQPWTSLFCLSAGITYAVSALYVASVFLAFDDEGSISPSERSFSRRAHVAMLASVAATVVVGQTSDAAVFATLPHARLAAFVALVVALFGAAEAARGRLAARWGRALVAVEVAVIALGAWGLAFPVAFFRVAASGETTVNAVTWGMLSRHSVPVALYVALVIGLLAVVPMVGVLFKVFKSAGQTVPEIDPDR